MFAFNSVLGRPERKLLVPYEGSSGDEGKTDSAAGSSQQGGGDVEKWSGRFKSATLAEELDKLGHKSFVPSTERKILWAVDLYKHWRWSRMSVAPAPDVNLMQGDIDGLNLNKACLAHSLCAFLSEIRRKDGQEFGGKGLYNLVILLQFHLEKRGFMWRLVEDPEFKKVRFTVDNLMKECCADRCSVSSSSSAISLSDEDKMWRLGVLGDDTPEKLRNTVMFLLGVCCALRRGQEHRDLRAPGFDPQVRICSEGGVEYLQYTQDARSKTNQGGLTRRKFVPKCVKVPKSPDEDRDLVRLYKKYVGLLPKPTKVSALYRYPLSSSRCMPCQWYSEKPIGVNCLKKMVANLTKEAGLSGRYTNHSLRVTAATRMYCSGIDEQVIKEITGHKSDSVRSYKKTSETLLREASLSTMCSREVADLSKDVVEPEKKVKVEEVQLLGPRGKSVHGRVCVDDVCSGGCEILKKLDTKIDQKAIKKMKLSLKYRKR